MHLSLYQHAILQEMGIPVWMSKEAYISSLKSETNRSENESGSSRDAVASQKAIASQKIGGNHQFAVSQPISQEEKQSRLEQLRANVGGVPKFKPKPTVMPQEISNAQSQPLGIPLSAQQKATSAEWLSDITLACVQLGLASNQMTILLGKSLNINEDVIVLPVPPDRLSGAQKRALWHELVKVSQVKR